MREMFFRAISKKTGEFIYGVPAPNSFGKYIFMVCLTLDDTCAYPMSKLPDFCEEIIPETLGEYSGVRDGTGEFIFEGDIVEVHFTGPLQRNVLKGKVVFLEGTWLVVNDAEKTATQLWSETNKVTIIGNIHENKNLLEGE